MLLRFTPKVDHIKTIYLIKEVGTRLTRNSVLLTPGVNEVTDDEYKCMVRSIIRELDTREIVPLASKISTGKGLVNMRVAKNLVELPVKQAVAYVNDCVSAETLTKWYKEETREEVRVQIVNKMEELGIDKPTAEIPEINENLLDNEEVNKMIGADGSDKEEPVAETEEVPQEIDGFDSEGEEPVSEPKPRGRKRG